MTTTRKQSDNQKGHQGFASMPKEQVKEIASKGGHASHGGTASSSQSSSNKSHPTSRSRQDEDNENEDE